MWCFCGIDALYSVVGPILGESVPSLGTVAAKLSKTLRFISYLRPFRHWFGLLFRRVQSIREVKS